MYKRVPCEKFRAQDRKVKLSGFIPPEWLTRLCYSVKKKCPWESLEMYVKAGNKA